MDSNGSKSQAVDPGSIPGWYIFCYFSLLYSP